MKSVISETELVMRVEHGSCTICRICYDVKKKIVLISTVSDGKKEVRQGICEDCQKIMDSCSTCRTKKF